MDALHLLVLILIHVVLLQSSDTGKSYVAMARFLEAHPADTELMAAASKRLLKQMKYYPDRVGNPIWNPPPQPGPSIVYKRPILRRPPPPPSPLSSSP